MGGRCRRLCWSAAAAVTVFALCAAAASGDVGVLRRPAASAASAATLLQGKGGNATAFGLADLRLTLASALADPTPVADPVQAQEIAHILATVNWKNGLILWVLPRSLRESLPLIVRSWIASVLFTYIEYFLSCAIWCKWIYTWYPNKQLEGKHPDWASMLKQVRVSAGAIPLYALLPPLSEHMILSGWTRCYGRIGTVGLPAYLGHFALYMLSVEFGVYWQHRMLHEVRWLYKWLHATHHIYNKEHTLSPFAGLAFHPLDGILQAVPYVWGLFLVPMHYFTHELLLFATGLWTANIHDCIHGRCEPVMGAAYHAIHHITYKHNYGHYTTLFDGLFGTLERPDDFEAKRRGGKAE